jgi:phosphoribosylanthranilate isomerase
MKVKLCGFQEQKSLQTAIDCGVDFIGLVFCDKSPRNISLQNAKILANSIPSNIFKVAVVMKKKIGELQEIYKAMKPDFFQLHGDYSIEKIKEIKKNCNEVKIIKAFNINTQQDLQKTEEFSDFVDFFLFDAKMSGSGQAFDWSLLKNFNSKKEWFLSGGLSVNNINKALEITGTKMIDISSGIEKIKGQKSPELIIGLMKKIKKC